MGNLKEIWSYTNNFKQKISVKYQVGADVNVTCDLRLLNIQKKKKKKKAESACSFHKGDQHLIL